MKTKVALLVLAGLVTGCRPERDLTLPTVEQIRERYSYQGDLDAALDGNVAVVTVSQPTAQIRRGGTLWAKVGPYVVLFSDDTRALLDAYPGLAGVRVETRITNGPEVARALLRRAELNDVLWRRSLNIAGHARRDGTERPVLLEDLVQWGEDHTEFEYNPRYARPR